MPEHRVRSHTRHTPHGEVGVRTHTRRHRGVNHPRGEAAAPPPPPTPARTVVAGVGGTATGLASVLLATSGMTIAAIGMAVSAVGLTVAAFAARKAAQAPAQRQAPARPAPKPRKPMYKLTVPAQPGSLAAELGRTEESVSVYTRADLERRLAQAKRLGVTAKVEEWPDGRPDQPKPKQTPARPSMRSRRAAYRTARARQDAWQERTRRRKVSETDPTYQRLNTATDEAYRALPWWGRIGTGSGGRSKRRRRPLGKRVGRVYRTVRHPWRTARKAIRRRVRARLRKTFG